MIPPVRAAASAAALCPLREGDFLKFFRLGLVASALFCLLSVSAFAAESEYEYDVSGDYVPDYVSASCSGDVISIYLKDAFFDAFAAGASREVALSMLSTYNWVLTVNGVVSSSLVFDWSVGSASFEYSGDGVYLISADDANFDLSLNVACVSSLDPEPDSGSASVSGVLSSASDVLAAVLGLVSLLAASFVVHPILLIGVILGFFGLAIAIFRRLLA
ncbi:MAG: hypothetical protein DBY24_10415 [Prevotellaceae bacterium]|nr:MAG: hypothetical protein DBY24_10415 [Prevotellaceae bacterium]